MGVVWDVPSDLFHIILILRSLPTFQHNSPICVIDAIEIPEMWESIYKEVHGSFVSLQKTMDTM